MSETPENAALIQLLGAISDRRIRRKIHKLLVFGEEAVRSLGELDSALYLREHGEEQLQIVADAVLSHVRRLLEYLGMVAGTGETTSSAPQELEFELSGGEPGDAPPRFARSSKESLRAAAVQQQTDDEKWNALVGEMDSLQYGLGSELREFDRRFSKALNQDRKEQAVRDLNDATSSLMDGVFVVMTAVYECFLGYAEPERMIPGHRDTLGKALAVRRALAVLRREVQELNQSIQDRSSSALVVETSYRLLVESLVRFIQDETFFYLRSDDRKEFEQFRELLLQGSPVRNRQVCEGFDKYLDSLAFVSQRGVLIKHDTDLRAKIATDLERALALVEIFPDAVCDLIHHAFVKADRLFGLNDQLDTLVYRWSSLSEAKRREVREVAVMARSLRDLVQPAAQAQPPDDSDFV